MDGVVGVRGGGGGCEDFSLSVEGDTPSLLMSLCLSAGGLGSFPVEVDSAVGVVGVADPLAAAAGSGLVLLFFI